MSARPFTLLIAALGGEGGGVLTDWIVLAAEACDLPVQSTSIPGVAQRTGATTYYIEIFPETHAQLGGKRHVGQHAVREAFAAEVLEEARPRPGRRRVGLDLACAGRFARQCADPAAQFVEMAGRGRGRKCRGQGSDSSITMVCAMCSLIL